MGRKLSTPKIEKLPSGSYRMRVMVDGKKTSITASTKSEVMQRYYEVKANGIISRNQKARPQSMTVRECLKQYVALRTAVLSPSTIRGYNIIIDNAFDDIINRPVSTLTDEEIQLGMGSRLEKHSPKSVRNEYSLLSSAIQTVTGREIKLIYPMVPRNEKQFLTAEQIPVFLEAIRGTKVETAALLGLHSLRRSEILDVTWDDIDLDHDLIMVRGAVVYDENYLLIHKKENKNASSQRTVPIIIPRLKELLMETEPKTGYIVKMAPNTVQRSIDRVCAKAGLPIVGCHGLRHSFASLALHCGLSPDVTMRIGGWADYTTMKKIYTHVSQADIKTAAGSMANFFSGRGKSVANVNREKLTEG